MLFANVTVAVGMMAVSIAVVVGSSVLAGTSSPRAVVEGSPGSVASVVVFGRSVKSESTTEVVIDVGSEVVIDWPLVAAAAVSVFPGPFPSSPSVAEGIAAAVVVDVSMAVVALAVVVKLCRSEATRLDHRGEELTVRGEH